ncbi:Deoxyhypusine synthase [Salix suchowensis]|nr:Deoxyhypusine synthase [Salix suchowensis]
MSLIDRSFLKFGFILRRNILNHNVEMIPSGASAAVLQPSEPVPSDAVSVKGPNFEKSHTLQDFLGTYSRIGFQAQSLGKAIEIVNNMTIRRPVAEDELEEFTSNEVRSQVKCNVFLGYTSNLISSGLREIFLYLVKHKHCLGQTYLADFHLDGADLRKRGMNRIGNLVVPNDNYCKSFIRRLGKEINNEESVYYWAYKNDIPVFCPALTDGSIGDMIYFHSFKSPGLILDIVRDIRELNELSRTSRKAGMIVLGGGVCKHQIANAMLIRNGADYSVFINTGQEFDGSDSGARPDEAVSWGKIRADAQAVKVYADATLVFPLLVAGTFASGD